jgi:hypothetical protein
MTLHSFRTASLSLTVAAALACASAAFAQAGTTSGSMPERSPATTPGQSTPAAPQPWANDLSQPNPAGAHQWTEDQILTATVHQAWQLAGRNEQNFFEIVRQLAEISARNRNLTLPDDPAAGKRAGEYIRDHAKADHDQLLYAIVDKAVQMTATKSPSSATTSSTQ